MYSGIPEVDTVTNTGNSNTLEGIYGASDAGGAPLDIGGSGLLQATGPIQFADIETPYSLGTEYVYDVNSDTDVTTTSVAMNPAIAQVSVCSTTGCSQEGGFSSLLFVYPPGTPSVTSVSPPRGTPLGGTPVAIGGANLGCVLGVSFGAVAASTFSPAQAILDCGQTGLVIASSPPGTPASKVAVTVTTVESVLTGATPVSSASFSYTRKAGSPAISTADGTTAVVGTHFSFTLKATGTGTITWRRNGALPKGVQFTPSTGGKATLSGTPAPGTGGLYEPTFTATNAEGSLGQRFTLEVDQKPSITSAATWTITQGAPAQEVVTSEGYPTPMLNLIGVLPNGLSATSEPDGSVVITGTPEAGSAGTYTVTLEATNEVGTVHKSLKIVVRK